MNDTSIKLPPDYKLILEESGRINFSMPSDLQTGCLLRTLIASKPKGDFLELGTGTGLSLSWIIEAMDKDSSVLSIDNNLNFVDVAKGFFKGDERVTIICENGEEWIKNNSEKKFDLIFADAWPGKYNLLSETLQMLKTGGFYIIDDMLPQPNWPEGHQQNAQTLITDLDNLKDFRITKMNWSTGVIIVCRIK